MPLQIEEEVADLLVLGRANAADGVPANSGIESAGDFGQYKSLAKAITFNSFNDYHHTASHGILVDILEEIIVDHLAHLDDSACSPTLCALECHPAHPRILPSVPRSSHSAP